MQGFVISNSSFNPLYPFVYLITFHWARHSQLLPKKQNENKQGRMWRRCHAWNTSPLGVLFSYTEIFDIFVWPFGCYLNTVLVISRRPDKTLQLCHVMLLPSLPHAVFRLILRGFDISTLCDLYQRGSVTNCFVVSVCVCVCLSVANSCFSCSSSLCFC